VKRTTIVGNAAQKIIPVSPQKDVYMAAYADNQRADDVLERIFRGRAHAHAPAGCTDETRRPDVMRAVADIIREGLAEALPGLRVRAVRWAAWRAGTHYFAPLDTTRFPTREAFLQWSVEPVRRVFLAGECLCQRQGWTEGALERVEDAVLPAAKQALSHDDIKK
jgi:monoamine oxidase